MICRLFVVCATVCSARATALRPGEIIANDYDFVVVIPDIHGELEGLYRSLWLAQKKVDPSRGEDLNSFKARFTAPEARISEGAGRVALVQLGDLVDRGPDSYECVATMSLLPTVLGWRVLQLYGNHELMTVMSPPGEVRALSRL